VPATLTVLDNGRPLSFSFQELLAQHGGNSPAGVAHAFKVMELAFPLVSPGSPPERSEVRIETAFGGPGARDAIEAVTGAVSDGRYVVDAGLERPELGVARERFVFRLSYRDASATLVVREGFVTEEFVLLARKERSPDEEGRLDRLKAEMASNVMAHSPEEVYEKA
jgi:hypothetical protein